MTHDFRHSLIKKEVTYKTSFEKVIRVVPKNDGKASEHHCTNIRWLARLLERNMTTRVRYCRYNDKKLMFVYDECSNNQAQFGLYCTINKVQLFGKMT